MTIKNILKVINKSQQIQPQGIEVRVVFSSGEVKRMLIIGVEGDELLKARVQAENSYELLPEVEYIDPAHIVRLRITENTNA